MPFESLSSRFEVDLPDFPAAWLPLTYLYDPDLPLFPVLYFHALDPSLQGQRPSYRDRVFGFVQYLNLTKTGATAGLVLNKDLSLPENTKYVGLVQQLVRERLGLSQPLKLQDIQNGMTDKLAGSNQVVEELWHQIVAPAFGNMLPFGRIWDEVLGLVRFIASWNSDGGRKGELIQTHYFASAFGERIATGNAVNVDFYLLPTFDELQDLKNPLSIFPKLATLVQGAGDFVAKYCDQIDIDGQHFSAFRLKRTGAGSSINTEVILKIINTERDPIRGALFENYNAFNRGPQRSIIALLMLHDLRTKGWSPNSLTPDICAKMYFKLKSSYQTPKVIQLYAQQCFAAFAALPIDIWVETFLKWPLGFSLTNEASFVELFTSSNIWGKLERLIWVAAQGRKVHASTCAEILWCIRYGGPDKQMRGANPLSCKICLPQIRTVCPAYLAIKDMPIIFNGISGRAQFAIATSAGNNTAPNQAFSSVTGPSIYDEYSSRDRPAGFRPYPQVPVKPASLSVDDFIKDY